MRSLGIVLFAVILAGSVRAGETSSPAAPEAPAPLEAVRWIFGGTIEWRGEIPAGELGPGSPARSSRGRMRCTLAEGGFAYLCEVEDAIGAGKDLLDYRAVLVVSWDALGQAYRAFSSDNTGRTLSYLGRLDGDRFTLQTPEEYARNGGHMKDRLVWTRTAGGGLEFRNERQFDEEEWKVYERAQIRKTSPGRK